MAVFLKLFFSFMYFCSLFLGIVPKTHSPGMFSWFPIFFPIKVSQLGETNSKFTVAYTRDKSFLTFNTLQYRLYYLQL